MFQQSGLQEYFVDTHEYLCIQKSSVLIFICKFYVNNILDLQIKYFENDKEVLHLKVIDKTNILWNLRTMKHYMRTYFRKCLPFIILTHVQKNI